MTLSLAQRVTQAVPFYAMEFAQKARDLKAQGRDVISLSIGEPNFTAPPPVVDTLIKAAQSGLSGYSPTSGLPTLRELIAQYYNKNFGTHITRDNVVITTGGSGALLLTCQVLLNPGDEVLMPDPYYPANYNFILTSGAIPRSIPTTAQERFQLSAQKIRENWTSKTRAILLASPSNPTGTSIAPDELQRICQTVKELGGIILLDEIYLGLTYEGEPVSGLVYEPEMVVLSSFSKYFNMTGWRLGWIVCPTSLVPALEKLSSSLTICPPTLAQHAAISCFSEESMGIYNARRESLKNRRDYLIPELKALHLDVPVVPDGAFYIFADMSYYLNKGFANSTDFALKVLEETAVAVAPGIDFGPTYARHMIRISYATELEAIKEAVSRLKAYLLKL